MNRLLVRTLPFSLTIAMLMIGLASFDAQFNLAKATNLPVAVLSLDRRETKLVRTLPEQLVAKPESINYKELTGDIVNIFKWMEAKNMTLSSFLNSFAGYGSDCRSGCFINLGGYAESDLLGLKSSKYIDSVHFSVYSNSGKDNIPDMVDITIKDTYQEKFSTLLFYQALVGSKVSYEERFQRVGCEEEKRQNCPKTRVYSQSIRGKYFANSSTKSLYKVTCDESITKAKKYVAQIRISLQ